MTQLGLESRIPRKENGDLIVTQSDLGSFKNCRRTWMLGSYLGLHSRHSPVVGPLRMGTRIHSALEQYYGYSRDLLEAYKEIVDDELMKLAQSGVVYDVSAWQSEIELGRVMLEGYIEYLAETGADEHLEVVGAEQVLEYPIEIDGRTVWLKGKIDCRVRDRFSGHNLVIDWKTTASFERLTTVAHLSEQLLTYMTLEKLVHRDNPDYVLKGAMYVMLRKVMRGPKARPPYYDRIEVHHSEQRLRSFYWQIVGTLRDYARVVDELDRGADHRMVAYPTPNWNTRYSPFRYVMEMMDDGSRVGDMLTDLFVQRDPHARYNSEKAGLLSEFE